MIKRILAHIQRLSRARRFRVPFYRRANFRIPSIVRIHDRTVTVASPGEHGAASDFVTCFIDDEYGLGELNDPITTIADIGANIGFFSMAARSYFPAATIHSYEPNPRIVPYATKNAAAAGFQLFSEAVGAAAGFISIEDTSDSNQARTAPASESGLRLPQVSLATVVERLGGRVDLAKIDCEGAEWNLFTDSTPWSAIRLVRMEYHLWGKHTYSEVQSSFDRLGFAIDHHASSGEWGTVWCHNLRG
jgi:FkbM family methyltransferase